MFHIQMRQFPHKAWRFNLGEAELRAVAVPWAREQWLEFGERKWNPHQAEITILEGPALEVQEISMGRGWRTAERRSQDITERVLATIKQADHERTAVAAPAQASPGPSDPLALSVQLGALLGSNPAELLAAWQQAAAGAPDLPPSETLAVAERELAALG